MKDNAQEPEESLPWIKPAKIKQQPVAPKKARQVKRHKVMYDDEPWPVEGTMLGFMGK